MLVGTRYTYGRSYIFTTLGQRGQGSVCINRPQSGVDARTPRGREWGRHMFIISQGQGGVCTSSEGSYKLSSSYMHYGQNHRRPEF